MITPAVSEYESFQRLQNGLAEAASAARELAIFRSDQSHEWEKMASLYDEAKNMAFVLVGGGEVGKARN